MSLDLESKTYRPERPQVATPTATAATPVPTDQRRSWWKIAVLSLAVIAVLIGLGAWVLQRGSSKKPVNMLTHQVTMGDVVVTVTEQGALESATNKEIKCTVKGGSTILWIIEDGTEVQPGDELVRLDSSTIEDNISQKRITYETALSTKIKSESDVSVAKISIIEYLEGTYEQERKTFENEIFVAEEELKKAELAYDSIRRSVSRGLVSPLQLQGEQFRVESARKVLELAQKKLHVLENYTKVKTLEELQGALTAAEAKLASDTESLKLEEARLLREKEQLQNCNIRAESSGMVIYPEAAEWKNQPEIEEGATVREQQTLLVIPDLGKMQVRVGVHESKVKRLKPGMPARIEVQDNTYSGELVSVATQASPSGWWDGNVRRFDAIVRLDSRGGLRPGMSADVEITVVRHSNVLSIPVAAVIGIDQQLYCWVDAQTGLEKRALTLGDSNDQFIVVEAGLEAGEQVVLNPRDFVEEAEFAQQNTPTRKDPQQAGETPTGPSRSNSNKKPPRPEGEVQPPQEQPADKPAEVAPIKTAPAAKPPQGDGKPSEPQGKPAQ